MTGDGSRRRVLAVHRYYAPDTAPYAKMLQSIVLQWFHAGFDVDVLSAQPSYKSHSESTGLPRKEQLRHGWVTRLSLPNEAGRPLVRLFNAFRLCAALFWVAIIRSRYDAIMISTSPPVIGGFFASLVAKLSGAKFIYHCMDVHPEIGRISGEFSHPWVYKALRALDAGACARADVVVVLSEDMKSALEARKRGAQCQIKVINNFSLPSEPVSGESDIEIDPNKFTILFAGNIGRFQGLEVLLEAMARLKSNPLVEAVLMGDGVMREVLEAEVARTGANVRFVGQHSVAVAKSAMLASSVGYVSLIEGIYRYAYPSKTTTYLEQGCPLLVSIEPEAELAKQVISGQFGAVVRPGDVEGLVDQISELAGNPNTVKLYREQAAVAGPKMFSSENVLPAWGALLIGLFK